MSDFSDGFNCPLWHFVDFIVILVIISSCKRENVKNGTNIS